ncbi:hypothetical protein [Sphaerisporangium aureirubrum]|uniref:DUF2188 domain-containing protein n=1 Tax=Sphaerisporangium aureirubrum TaxID=1544736 RepID=A0ABW1NM32_9ACTN
MAHPRTRTAAEQPRQWHIFRSDTGRWWATRTEPFSQAQQRAGAARTVDGDDEVTVCRAIAEQESTAALAGTP